MSWQPNARMAWFARLLAVGGLFFCLLMPAVADDAGDEASVEIVKAKMTLHDDDVFYLDGRFNLSLNATMREALLRGIPLTFVIHVEVTHPRRYLWDRTVAEIDQAFRLEYLSLSQQYLLRNLNLDSHARTVLPTLDVALSVLGTIIDLPVIDSSLLVPDETYRGRMKVELRVDDLPLPLRLQSYMSSDWTLESDWYSWPIRF